MALIDPELSAWFKQRVPYGFTANQYYDLLVSTDRLDEFLDKLDVERAYDNYTVWGKQLWSACYFKSAYHPKPWKDAPEYYPPTESPYDPD